MPCAVFLTAWDYRNKMLQRVLEPEIMDTWEDAAEYDAMDFTDVNAAFAQRAVEVGPRSGLVLDAGTGTARIPILICQQRPDWRMIGIDLSKNMLVIGSKNILKAGLVHQIDLQLIDAKTLPYQDAHFDMVISNSIVHHIPDPIPFLHEVKRVLKPSGAVLLRDLFRPPDESTLNAILERECANDDEHQTMLFRNSLQAAFTLDEIRSMVDAAGIEGAHLYQSSDRHWTLEKQWSKE